MRFHQLYIVYPILSDTKYLTIKTLQETFNTNDTKTYGTGIISCNCTNSRYLNHHHGHIITGDLRIIESKKTL